MTDKLRMYAFEASGTRSAYEDGKELETKRIGKPNEGIEDVARQVAENAFQAGYRNVRISVELL